MIQVASVLDVAKYILEKYGPLSVMKLQKLIYYSQAWGLVWDNQPIFVEEVQAWASGPVIKELYQALRGTFKISVDMIDGNPKVLTKEQKETIDAVCKFYIEKEPQELSDMVRQESPWINARIGIADGERSDRIISKESMKEYYSNI